MITKVDTFEEFTRVLDEKGGFVLAPWDGTTETEIRIKELTKATIRCIPFDSMEEGGVDMLTGKPSQRGCFSQGAIDIASARFVEVQERFSEGSALQSRPSAV